MIAVFLLFLCLKNFLEAWVEVPRVDENFTVVAEFTFSFTWMIAIMIMSIRVTELDSLFACHN